MGAEGTGWPRGWLDERTWKGFLGKRDGGWPTREVLPRQFSGLWGKGGFALWPGEKFCGLQVYL